MNPVNETLGNELNARLESDAYRGNVNNPDKSHLSARVKEQIKKKNIRMTKEVITRYLEDLYKTNKYYSPFTLYDNQKERYELKTFKQTFSTVKTDLGIRRQLESFLRIKFTKYDKYSKLSKLMVDEELQAQHEDFIGALLVTLKPENHPSLVENVLNSLLAILQENEKKKITFHLKEKIQKYFARLVNFRLYFGGVYYKMDEISEAMFNHQHASEMYLDLKQKFEKIKDLPLYKQGLSKQGLSGEFEYDPKASGKHIQIMHAFYEQILNQLLVFYKYNLKDMVKNQFIKGNLSVIVEADLQEENGSTHIDSLSDVSAFIPNKDNLSPSHNDSPTRIDSSPDGVSSPGDVAVFSQHIMDSPSIIKTQPLTKTTEIGFIPKGIIYKNNLLQSIPKKEHKVSTFDISTKTNPSTFEDKIYPNLVKDISNNPAVFFPPVKEGDEDKTRSYTSGKKIC